MRKRCKKYDRLMERLSLLAAGFYGLSLSK